MVVDFFRVETYTCGSGCCTHLSDYNELVATRTVTDSQLEKLNSECDSVWEKYWTEDFGIDGEDERFNYFIVRD
jgi:hypothetical protein